jgi:hypothetical protein
MGFEIASQCLRGSTTGITETLRQRLHLWRAIALRRSLFASSARPPTYLLANLEGAWKIFAFVGPRRQ